MDQFYYLSVGPSQSLRGEVLFADKYGRISDEQVLINPIANVIGTIAIVFHLPLTVSFNIFTILSSLALAFCFLFFVKQFTDNVFIQYTALTIYCFSGGFDFYFKLFRWCGIDALDDSMPEANMFMAMVGEYYLPLANALFILVLTKLYRILFKGDLQIWVCGMLLFALGAVYIYGLVSAVLIISIIVIIEGLRNGDLKSNIIILTKLAMWCLPIALYYTWVLVHFPSIKDSGWYSFPPFPALLSTFGFAFCFLVIGLFIKQYKIIKKELFLMMWIVIVVVLIYMPQHVLPVQIQWLIGLGAPLAVLFATSIEAIFNKTASVIKNPKHVISFKHIVIIFLIICCSMTNIKFYIRQFEILSTRTFPYYLHTELYDGIQWSTQRISPKKKVLLSHKMGAIFSSFTGCAVYCNVGPETETTIVQKNTDLLLSYFKANQIDSANDLLNKETIDYIFLDQTLGGVNFSKLRLVMKKNYKECYANHEVSIFDIKANTISRLETNSISTF